MKTFNLKFVLGILALFVSAQAFCGSEGKGGGAGCTNPDGSLNTLYYCGAYKEPSSGVITGPVTYPQPPPPSINDGPSQIPPELQALQDYISNFPYLSLKTKTILLDAMKPSFIRRYFQTVMPPELTAPIVVRIKAEFQRATGLDINNLQLYGVTDVNASISNYRDKVPVT